MELHWHTEPFLLLSLLAVSWFYSLLTLPFRHRWDPERGVRVRDKAILFHTGVFVTYLTVGSPLDQLGEDYLFFMHMIQHILLVYIIPPMFFLGVPKELAEYLVSPKSIRASVRALGHPVVAGLLFNFTYTIWHVPLLYEAALHSKPIHMLEHATMFFTAVFMWWPLLSQVGGSLAISSYGVRILYAFLLMVAQLPVFAFLVFANVPLYETYVWAPRIIEGLTPLDDQIVGGLIMKVCNMIVSLSIISYCFFQWARSDSSASASASRGKVSHA